MAGLFGSAVLEMAVGLIVIYLLLSLVCVGIQELLANWFSLRATSLRRGIALLLCDPYTIRAVMQHPLVGCRRPVRGKGRVRLVTLGIARRDRAGSVSHISAETFSRVLVDVLVPKRVGPLTADQLGVVARNLQDLGDRSCAPGDIAPGESPESFRARSRRAVLDMVVAKIRGLQQAISESASRPTIGPMFSSDAKLDQILAAVTRLPVDDPFRIGALEIVEAHVGRELREWALSLPIGDPASEVILRSLDGKWMLGRALHTLIDLYPEPGEAVASRAESEPGRPNGSNGDVSRPAVDVVSDQPGGPPSSSVGHPAGPAAVGVAPAAMGVAPAAGAVAPAAGAVAPAALGPVVVVAPAAAASVTVAPAVAFEPAPLQSVTVVASSSPADAAEIGAIIARIETWYEEGMERVADGYRRRVQTWLFVIALLVAACVNADTMHLVNVLAISPTVREATLRQIDRSPGSVPSATPVAASTPVATSTPLDLAEQLREATGLIGYPNASFVREVLAAGAPVAVAWVLVTKVIGLLLTAVVVSLLAPWCFDLRQAVRTTRSPRRPARTPSSGAIGASAYDKRVNRSA